MLAHVEVLEEGETGEMASHTIYESIAHKNFVMDMCKVLINCLAPVLTKEVPELE